MRQQKILMGMTITVDIADKNVTENAFDLVFSYFKYIDDVFSTYKDASEISKINRGEIKPENYSPDMKEVFKLSEETKKITNGYFDIKTPAGKYDPSGLVKGWAIYNASKILHKEGFTNFFIDAGGDIQTSGKNEQGQFWSVGIRNPFNPETEIVKALTLDNKGIATSGTYIRGDHIYNPLTKKVLEDEIVSLTVIGPNVYEADRFATAAFAMGKEGISFIEKLDGFEGYSIDKKGIATMTTHFNTYIKQ